MDNANVFWTFQDPERNAIDNFEQQPLNPALNTVMGMASQIGATTFEELLFNMFNTSYNPAPPRDTAFVHDTIGLKLQAPAQATYTTAIPAGPARDVSMYTHLTLRIAKKSTVTPAMPGPDLTVYVNIEDGQAHTGFTAVNTGNFQRSPHPFAGSRLLNLATLTGIRIPLRYFTINNSQVDLTNVAKIKIVIDNTEIGLDDIEFGK